MFSQGRFQSFLIVLLFLVGAACAMATVNWPAPVTPGYGPLPSVGSNEMKLVDVQGSVWVETPDGHSTFAVNGMILPSGSSISTMPTSSVSVLMGGVNSLRFTQKSEGTVSQNLDGSERKTVIDLRKGTVFCWVKQHEGEKQNFKVTTPQGVAVAHGTVFAVTVITNNFHGYTTVYTKEGTVLLTDNSNGNLLTVSPTQADQVALATIPPPDQENAGLLGTINQGNTTPSTTAF